MEKTKEQKQGLTKERLQEADRLLQEVFGIARKLDEIKVFHNILPFNNTELQFMKVIVLAEEEGKRVISSDIARSLGITRSAVSQMVKKLEEQNVIVRIPAENDKKSSHVVLSKGARAAYECVKDYMNAFTCQIVDRVGVEEITGFIAGMNRFIDIFNDVLAEIPQTEADTLKSEMENCIAAEAEAAEAE